jgi:hypothetical protein
VDDAMEAIEGDGSARSYLAASLLRRQLDEVGALWHGCRWSVPVVLDKNPLKARGPKENETPLDWPTAGSDPWTWHEQEPSDWSPQVKVEADRVTVTFYTYCGLEKQRIYRHVDTCKPGKYRARVKEKEIATGGNGVMF